jgi:hypothetical protein
VYDYVCLVEERRQGFCCALIDNGCILRAGSEGPVAMPVCAADHASDVSSDSVIDATIGLSSEAVGAGARDVRVAVMVRTEGSGGPTS